MPSVGSEIVLAAAIVLAVAAVAVFVYEIFKSL